MSNRTIAEFRGLVILLAVVVGLTGSCSQAASSDRSEVDLGGSSSDYEKPVVVGRIESNEITESSGLASSLCQPGILWTHNASRDCAFPAGVH